VDESNFYGFKDNDFFRTSVDVVTARVEHDINDTFSVRDQFRYGRYQRQARITEPQVLASVNPGLNFFTPYSRLQVTRNQITTRSTETFLQNQADVTARFRSGPLDHTVVTGFEVGKETSDPTRRAYTGVPTTSLVSPNSSQPFAGVDTVSSRVNTTADTLGVYALDTIKLGEHWQLIAGVRYDRFDADYRNAVPGAPVVRLDRVDDMFSYRAALVYKPVTDLSTYFSYGTSFNPSAESLALAANTASLAPEKTRSYEVGAKWDTLDQRLSLTGSIFRLEKSNARQTDPNDATLLVLAGNAQVDGFEIGATGHITDRLEVFAGYSYQNARLTAAPRPQDVGHALQNAPRDTLSFFSTYRLPWQDIKLGFGGNYVSRRNASTSASTTAGDIAGVIRSVPGYFTMQASASYPLSKNVELQANVYNISDRSYYDLPHPNHVIPGAGTSALFGINVKL
jgi:catecholate siderophore receptor